MMIQALVWGGLAVASFAAAAALVLAIVRASEHRDDSDGVGPADPADRRHPATERSPWGAESAWWPEFEREFAAYVRAGERRRS